MEAVDVGSQFAGYRIEAVAGRGGMGVVYRARQQRPDRVVALKVLAPEVAADPGFRERFERESQTAASIEHPNVIPVYDVGEEAGLLYIAMRFVDGMDFRERIGLAPSPEEVVRVVHQTADALDAAHASGLVHRDVKPGNVLITTPGGRVHAYLTDFGLTKQTAASQGLTSTGAFVGTIDYVAPEQIEGRQVDARADVYSLACVLYHALTGSPPYPRDSGVATMWAHLNEPPPSLSDLVDAETASAFGPVIDRGMAKAPDDRFPSAGDLGRAASAALDGRSPSAERTVAKGDAAPSRTRTKATERLDPVRSSDAPSTAPSRPGKANRKRVAIGVSALALVATGGAILAVSGGGTGGKEPPVERIGRVVGPPTPLPSAPTAVAAGAGHVWVASAREGTVLPIDARSGKADRRSIRVGREPAGVAVGEGFVWVANAKDGTLTRIDPQTKKVSGGPIEVGAGPRDVAVGYGSVWTADYGADSVTRVDPRGGRTITIRVGDGPSDVAVGAGAVWTVNVEEDTLTRINPASNRVVGSPIPVGESPESVVTGAGGVWVANIDTDTVRRVDPASNQADAPIRVGSRPDDLASWNDGIYVANQDSDTLVRIDPKARAVAGRPLRVGNDPSSLAAAGRELWVVNFLAQQLVRVRP